MESVFLCMYPIQVEALVSSFLQTKVSVGPDTTEIVLNGQ